MNPVKIRKAPLQGSVGSRKSWRTQSPNRPFADIGFCETLRKIVDVKSPHDRGSECLTCFTTAVRPFPS